MPRTVIVYLWAFLLGKVLAIEPPLPGYLVEVLQWEVPVSLDGRTATLNGTVQQVYQQLLELNPSYEVEFGTVENRYSPTPSQTHESSEALENIEQEDSWSNCGHFDPADAEAVWEGVIYLNHVSGRPGSAPGPGACGQVSCSYDSAIWWCNDLNTDKSLSSYADIGSSVQLLTASCTYWSESHFERQVSGQQFHTDSWNTIVRGAVC